MHWVSYEKLCKPKNKGGFGFKDLGDFNQAMLAKQAWRLVSDPQSLVSRIYKAQCYKRNDFLEAGVWVRPS